MKLLIASDSHGLVERVQEVLESEPFSEALHCGDYCHYYDLYPFTAFQLVRGNCDDDEQIPEERLLEWQGLVIFMTHGHLYGVKSNLKALKHKAKAVDADLVLFGHSHIATAFVEEGICYINPGSLREPKGLKVPSYVTVEVVEGEEKKIRVTFLQVGGEVINGYGGEFILRSKS